jgi:hypothetical protein
VGINDMHKISDSLNWIMLMVSNNMDQDGYREGVMATD